MKRIPRDPVRELIVKSAPPAMLGMKKHYNQQTRAVEYRPKTAREQLRDGLRKKP